MGTRMYTHRNYYAQTVQFCIQHGCIICDLKEAPLFGDVRLYNIFQGNNVLLQTAIHITDCF